MEGLEGCSLVVSLGSDDCGGGSTGMGTALVGSRIGVRVGEASTSGVGEALTSRVREA